MSEPYPQVRVGDSVQPGIDLGAIRRSIPLRIARAEASKSVSLLWPVAERTIRRS